MLLGPLADGGQRLGNRLTKLGQRVLDTWRTHLDEHFSMHKPVFFEAP